MLRKRKRAELVTSQDTGPARPKLPHIVSIPDFDARPGKRSIHDTAKVKIDMYIKNKEGNFILWPFGKLHDCTFDEVCTKIAAEYDRPIDSIVFDIIAGTAVTSVEIARSSDVGYQRLDEKLGMVVKTCKHGGCIRINADPQTPEDADPSWVYDPL